MTKKAIPLYVPDLTDLEKGYAISAINSGWISSKGEFVNKFETEFAKKINRKHAVAVCNGTIALHVAIEALKPFKAQTNKQQAILCPSLTYVSTANTIRQSGLVPLFIDVDESGVSTNKDVEDGLTKAKELNLEVVAIMPVHVYGNMSSIVEENKFGIPIIEDCAEAFGSKLNGNICGNSKADVSCFSFFGNKTITTGEGGMVACDNDDLYNKIILLKSVGQKPSIPQRYNHIIVGFNYRMTNICAAIGLGQLARAEEIVQKKQTIASWYKKYLDKAKLLSVSKNTDSSYWLITLITKNTIIRDGLALFLESNGIETRPAFLPMHAMYNLKPYARVDDLSVSEAISSCGLNLPSWPNIQETDVKFICDCINEYTDTV